MFENINPYYHERKVMSNLRTLNRREFMRFFAAGAAGWAGGCHGGITKGALEQQHQPNMFL